MLTWEAAEQNFLAYMHGSETAFLELMQHERSCLFDYIQRMTGDDQRARNATEEVWSAIQKLITHYPDYHNMRVSLFATARRFNLDGWQTNPTQIIETRTEAIEPLATDPLLLAVDQALCFLPAPEREAVLLHFQNGFSVEDVVQITSSASNLIEKYIAHGKQQLQQVLGEDQDIADFLYHMPRLRNPGEEDEGTVAISQVISDVSSSKFRWWFGLPPALIVLVLMVFGAVVVWWLFFK